ncbi:MAG: S9 family peptidase, partial [Candidatus Krumholzibacteriia bacterium]
IALAALALALGVSEWSSAGASAPADPGRARTAGVAGGPRALTIERIYADPPLTGRAPSSIRWLPDSKGVTYLRKVGEGDAKQTHLIVSRVTSGKERILCVADTIAVPEDLLEEESDKFAIGSYRWAKKGSHMVFRFKGDIFTFDSRNGRVVRRTRSEEKEGNVAFAPDGDKIAFTRGHDLWTVDLESNTERRLTTTGTDSLLNGVLDWVYMEELFTRGNVKGYWWAPDSRSIAYLEIDESPVREFPIVDFVPAYNTADMQHYPKAGAANPVVRIGVYNLERGTTRWLGVDTSDDGYIARVYWLRDGKTVAIEKLNRNQDKLSLLFADSETGGVREILEESKDTWINVTYMKHYYENKDLFVWNAERDGNSHLYLYKSDGTQVRQLTRGPWEVSALNGVDEKRGHVYFTALKTSVLERHLYRVAEKGGRIRQVTKRPGTHQVTFSPDYRYYIDRFSNTDTPRVISVHDAAGKALFTIDEADRTELAGYGLPVSEFFAFTSKDGLEFQCSMIKPPNFDASKKYPVLVYVYGGPHAQVVRNRWGGSRYLWHAYMAQRGCIVFSLDNRGSYGRGTEWEDPILKNMGRVELEDQVAGVEYLKSLPYVDGSRIGIWGWSYGGYMTSLAMFKTPGVYRAGASVAPVTDWRFYDTIYTERYMKRPQDNEDGYDEAAPINFVEGLQAPFLLVHGTADDNVHMANSIRLVHELIKEGKAFDLMVYPRKLHGISGRTSRVHLYKRLTRFFDEHLLAGRPEETTLP